MPHAARDRVPRARLQRRARRWRLPLVLIHGAQEERGQRRRRRERLSGVLLAQGGEKALAATGECRRLGGRVWYAELTLRLVLAAQQPRACQKLEALPRLGRAHGAAEAGVDGVHCAGGVGGVEAVC